MKPAAMEGLWTLSDAGTYLGVTKNRLSQVNLVFVQYKLEMLSGLNSMGWLIKLMVARNEECP